MLLATSRRVVEEEAEDNGPRKEFVALPGLGGWARRWGHRGCLRGWLTTMTWGRGRGWGPRGGAGAETGKRVWGCGWHRTRTRRRGRHCRRRSGRDRTRVAEAVTAGRCSRNLWWRVRACPGPGAGPCAGPGIGPVAGPGTRPGPGPGAGGGSVALNSGNEGSTR